MILATLCSDVLTDLGVWVRKVGSEEKGRVRSGASESYICTGGHLEQQENQEAFGRPNFGIFLGHFKVFVDRVSGGNGYENGGN